MVAMSLHRRAARRDANEAEIIAALRAVGATVQQLSGEDVPDLLVGFRGVDHLMEIKRPLGPRGGHAEGIKHVSLTPDQAKWHAAWRGRPPVVVRTVDEALAAIGAVVTARVPPSADVEPGRCDAISDAISNRQRCELRTEHAGKHWLRHRDGVTEW
jgi:hypothetical protein